MLIHTYHVIIAQADAASAHRCVQLGITPLSIACPAVLRFGCPPVRVRRGIRIALGTGFQTNTDTHEYSNSNPFLHGHPHTNAHAHLYSNTYAISDSDPAAATHAIPGPRTDSRPNSHSYTNAFTHPNAYSDACTHSNTNSNSHSYTNAFTHPNAYSDACAHSNTYPVSDSSFIPGAGLRDSSDCHANADPLSNPHFIPHTHTNAISYSYTNAGTHCPTSGNASRPHRSGWTPFMRAPLRRLAHLLGERRQGTIVSSSRPHVHRTQPWRRPYLWPRSKRFARVLG